MKGLVKQANEALPVHATYMGLHQLACNVSARVVDVHEGDVSSDASIAQRLMEIGFLPGEPVKIVATGFPGGDPLAVRIGHATFALRRYEASLVQVQPEVLS